jgi:hypothetical protein
VCVEDSRAPAGCEISWRISDPCSMLSEGSWLEGALFIAGCPGNSGLASGYPAGDLLNQVVASNAALAAYRGLEQAEYGFGVMLRDQNCTVIGYGCSDANLAQVSVIQTAIRNWGAVDVCSLGSGLCAAGTACNAGRCEMPAP